MVDSVDVAILGGGCAGLSIAARLAALGDACPTIRIVEPRTTWTRDRTWCGWSNGSVPFDDAVAHRWPRWTVRHAGRVVACRAADIHYFELPADRFYALALERLATSPEIELTTDCRAQQLTRTDTGWRVETDRGAFMARLVLDGRPDGLRPSPPAPSHAARAKTEDGLRLWQHFRGRRVRLERPVFDPATVTLMDFDVDQRSGLRFVYVLPYSRHEALVESTHFSTRVQRRSAYDAEIDDYLAARFGPLAHETIGVEGGCLPMFEVNLPSAGPGHVRIGLAGGAARPSTGYAFLAIQRDAERIVRTIRRHGVAAVGPSPARPWRRRAMDAIFLAFLRNRPERAPAVFARLFERVPADVMARFMGERSSPFDELRVAAAMPIRSFLGGALASGEPPRAATWGGEGQRAQQAP